MENEITQGKEDDNVIEEFKAPAKKEWEKPKVEKEFKWTVSAIFELPNGERVEIPEPGPKWSLDKEKSYSWPSKYVRAKGEFFFKMREHEITYRINHPIGKMIWAEYREQLFKEQARVLSTRHWSREVTPKIVVSTEGPILRKLW